MESDVYDLRNALVMTSIFQASLVHMNKMHDMKRTTVFPLPIIAAYDSIGTF